MKTTGNVINQTTIDDLSERIKIIYKGQKRNKRGDIIATEDISRCEVWAKIYPYSSKRTDDKGVELFNEVTYRIVIRYRQDIMPDDIIIWRGKRLKQTITPYDAEARKIYLILEAKEQISDGKTK